MGHTLKAVQLMLLSKKPRTEASDKRKDHGEAGNRASSLVLPLPLWLTLSGLSFMDLSFYPYRELTELGPSSIMLVSIQVAAVMRGYGLGACQMGCVKNAPLYIYLYPRMSWWLSSVSCLRSSSLPFRAYFQLQAFEQLGVKSPDMQLFYKYHKRQVKGVCSLCLPSLAFLNFYCTDHNCFPVLHELISIRRR